MPLTPGWVAALVIATGVLVYVIQEMRRRRTERALQTAERELEVARARLEDVQDRLVDQRHWIEQQSQLLQERVSASAAQLLEEKARRFTELNRRELDALVGPFREQLGEFRRRVDDIYAQDTRDRVELREKIQSLTELNQLIGRQALELTQALTINTKSTGDWGETILQKILEDSGLRRDREYRLQVSIVGIEGEDQRPDAVIFLPEKRQLIVDAKVSNKAWKDYCAASEDGVRERCLQAHLASLRAHMKGLAQRDYARSPDLHTVDFVLMFVPVEAALLTALAHDGELYTEAYRQKIILVTPTTLLAVVKLVEGMWLVEKRRQSADEIAEAGRKLYEKLVNFSESFLEVGAALESAQDAFERAQRQLATGRGNAVRLAQRMTELGVQPAAGKSLPPELLELAEEEAELDRDRTGG